MLLIHDDDLTLLGVDGIHHSESEGVVCSRSLYVRYTTESLTFTFYCSQRPLESFQHALLSHLRRVTPRIHKIPCGDTLNLLQAV